MASQRRSASRRRSERGRIGGQPVGHRAGSIPAVREMGMIAWYYYVELRRVICSTKRDRVSQCPLPARDQGSRLCSVRAGSDEMPLPGDPIPGPNRPRQDTMDDEVEASAQGVCNHLCDRFPAAEAC
jgi:hypothetical protein